MLNVQELDFTTYPELLAFITRESIDMSPLQKYYKFSNDEGEEFTVSLIEICAGLGLLDLLDRTLNLQFDSDDLRKAFRLAAANSYEKIVERLLTFPQVLDHFFMTRRYRLYISNFLHIQISGLSEKINRNPAYDIPKEEFPLYFSALKFFAYFRDPNLSPAFIQLMTLPAMRKMQTSELREVYVIALQRMNETVLACLGAMFDLSKVLDEKIIKIKTDSESSLYALDKSESEKLTALKKHYAIDLDAIDPKKIDKIIQDFKTYLQKKYTENPASIIIQNKKIDLPLTWQEFQALKLDKSSLGEANKAYYQNIYHTALRYLSKPNYWIDKTEKANYKVPVKGKYGRDIGYCAEFEGALAMIALMWLAASDAALVGKEYSLEDRITLFIKEIALIGRGHNWDGTRIVTRLSGKRVEEYFDDLGPDDPSCLIGTNRRLFQSLLGHPLVADLLELTKDVLNQEIDSFAYQHFKTLLSQKSVTELQKIKDGIEDSVANYDAPPPGFIVNTNIPKQKIEEFKSYLNKKYGDFSKNKTLTDAFNSALTLSGNTTHITLLYLRANIAGLIKLPATNTSSPTPGPSTSAPNAVYKDILQKFNQKTIQLETKALLDCEYIDASKKARELYNKLEEHCDNYFNKKSLSLAQFKDRLDLLIDSARPVLEPHRGWKKFLYDFAFLVTNLATLGVASLVSLATTGSIRFFAAPPTDSIEKLKTLRQELFNEVEKKASSDHQVSNSV